MRAPAQTQLGLNFHAPAAQEETFEEALDMTFPVRESTEEELYREFLRLFPLGTERG